jgi:exo-beta-1,3-glucanase (GH17 family)
VGLPKARPQSRGLRTTLTLDRQGRRSQRKITTALDLVRRYPNVIRLVVGNETVYRRELTVADLVKIVRRVKRDSPIPVGSAENWQTFIDHPELVGAVDQVFAHIRLAQGNRGPGLFGHL